MRQFMMALQEEEIEYDFGLSLINKINKKTEHAKKIIEREILLQQIAMKEKLKNKRLKNFSQSISFFSSAKKKDKVKGHTQYKSKIDFRSSFGIDISDVKVNLALCLSPEPFKRKSKKKLSIKSGKDFFGDFFTVLHSYFIDTSSPSVENITNTIEEFTFQKVHALKNYEDSIEEFEINKMENEEYIMSKNFYFLYLINIDELYEHSLKLIVDSIELEYNSENSKIDYATYEKTKLLIKEQIKESIESIDNDDINKIKLKKEDLYNEIINYLHY